MTSLSIDLAQDFPMTNSMEIGSLIIGNTEIEVTKAEEAEDCPYSYRWYQLNSEEISFGYSSSLMTATDLESILQPQIRLGDSAGQELLDFLDDGIIELVSKSKTPIIPLPRIGYFNF